MKNRIAITTTSFGVNDTRPLDLLKERGFDIVMNPHGRKLKHDEIIELCNGAVGMIAGTEKLDAAVMEQLSGLRVISRCGTGMDNVDRTAAERAGIKVFNTPDAPTLAVAELTVGLMLDLLRKVSLMDREVRSGLWNKRMGNLLSEKQVGIIGFGRIGRKVAELVHAFNCTVSYYDLHTVTAVDGATPLLLQDLLAWADIITVHVSSPEPLLGRTEVEQMKPGAWLINASRGGVVDEAALADALREGRLSGAALDVFGQEPYAGPLNNLPTMIMTPHIGSYALEARSMMELQAAENLLRGLAC